MSDARRPGRPKKALDQLRKRVTTRIEPRKRERILAYAQARGVSVGELIDEHVRRRSVP